MPPSPTSICNLPVELIADILSDLDLTSLASASCSCRRLRAVAANALLNPWKLPIIRTLRGPAPYDSTLRSLGARLIVPRHNWIEILSIAQPNYLLFDIAIPNLNENEWEECFKRRFLPGWARWRRGGTWKEVYMKVLWRIWHRLNSTCTTDESWTSYIVLNRNASVNLLTASSPNFNPMALFNVLKDQNNLHHLDTQIRIVVQFTDTRILAFGVLNHPKAFQANHNASSFLHPPGVGVYHLPQCEDLPKDKPTPSPSSTQFTQTARVFSGSPAHTHTHSEHFLNSTNPPIMTDFMDGASSSLPSKENLPNNISAAALYPAAKRPATIPARPLPEDMIGISSTRAHARRIASLSPYPSLKHPCPVPGFRHYPNYTAGGSDKRWVDDGELEEGGKLWAGPLLLVAQLIPASLSPCDTPDGTDLLVRHGGGRRVWASFSWEDLWAIAPWMQDILIRRIEGPGLGNI